MLRLCALTRIFIPAFGLALLAVATAHGHHLVSGLLHGRVGGRGLRQFGPQGGTRGKPLLERDGDRSIGSPLRCPPACPDAVHLELQCERRDDLLV